VVVSAAEHRDGVLELLELVLRREDDFVDVVVGRVWVVVRETQYLGSRQLCDPGHVVGSAVPPTGGHGVVQLAVVLAVHHQQIRSSQVIQEISRHAVLVLVVRDEHEHESARAFLEPEADRLLGVVVPVHLHHEAFRDRVLYSFLERDVLAVAFEAVELFHLQHLDSALRVKHHDRGVRVLDAEELDVSSDLPQIYWEVRLAHERLVDFARGDPVFFRAVHAHRHRLDEGERAEQEALRVVVVVVRVEHDGLLTALLHECLASSSDTATGVYEQAHSFRDSVRLDSEARGVATVSDLGDVAHGDASPGAPERYLHVKHSSGSTYAPPSTMKAVVRHLYPFELCELCQGLRTI